LERDLHDGAQQLIVALNVKIGLAKAMAAKHGSSTWRASSSLGAEADGALGEVRRLAKGIYPAVWRVMASPLRCRRWHPGHPKTSS
jgi:signal transduction histidine kinase